MGFKVRLLLPEKIHFQNCQLIQSSNTTGESFSPKTGVPLRGKAMSQTVDTILFTLRVAARVESSAVYLLQHADGYLGNGREGQRDHPKSLEMVSWVVDASLVSIIISYL